MILQIFQGVADLQVAPKQVGVGQVHDNIDLGLRDDEEVEGFSALVTTVIQQPPLHQK